MERAQRPRVAHFGEHGAYTEEAALNVFGDAETVPCPSFAAVFAAVVDGAADFGVIAVENSLGGWLNETYDLLMKHHETLTIRAEYDLPVHHCLLALPGETLETITTVLSHPQAIAQTRAFWEPRGYLAVVGGDTAGSARRIRDEGLRGHAAISGRRAAEYYRLNILAENIEDTPDNFTKFLILARHETPCSAETFALRPLDPALVKTALVYAVRHVPGSLYHSLGPLAQNGLNLTKIESRPLRERPWEYLFYVDVEGDSADPRYQSALAELREHCTFLAVLGSYSVLNSARAIAAHRQ